MALKNQSLVIAYTAWNTSTNLGATADSANHTLKVIVDGTEQSVVGSITEVDSTSAKGEYSVTLTAANMNGNFIKFCGASSTANVIIVPIPIATERGVLPNVAPTTQGAPLTFGTSAGQLSTSSGQVSTSSGTITTVTGNIDGNVAGSVASVSGNVGGNVGGNVVGSVASVTAAVVLPAIPTNWITATGITAAALNGKGDWATSTSVWDQSTTGHTTSGSFGAAMNAAGSAGDPWATSLPGAYGSGTAGNIVGNNIDATIASRSTYAGGDTAGTTTLLGRVTGAVALASQIPANFTTATFASAGVFATAALANAPTGGSAPTTSQIATAVWEDLTAGGDFGTAGSIGKFLTTNLDANVGSRMATYSQPTGFLTATFPSGTVANTTNITAGTVTTTTNLTNLPSIPNNWLTAAGINAGALNGKGDWLLASGYTSPPSAATITTTILTDLVSGSDFQTAGSLGKLLTTNLDTNVGSRMATYSQPTGFLAATFPTTLASPTNITAGTITTTTNLTNLPAIPANWLTATGIAASALNGKGDWLLASSYTAAPIASVVATAVYAGMPTGFMATTFPTGTVASTTNITGGTITTATNLTNAPTSGDFTSTMKSSLVTAAGVPQTGDSFARLGAPVQASISADIQTRSTYAGGAVASVTGNVGGSVASVTGNVGGNVTGSVGSVTGNVGGNVVGSVSSVISPVAITSNLKTNQALDKFSFVMTDATTHQPKPGLFITAQRRIDAAGSFSACANVPVDMTNGDYTIDLAASDLSGAVTTLLFTATGADVLLMTLVLQP